MNQVSPLGALLAGLLLTAAASSAAPPATYTDPLGIRFRLIPAGSFEMGCETASHPCDQSELPAHRVTIAAPFYLGETEVTQRQWTAVTGHNPAHFTDPDNPVEQVSWDDAQAFLRALEQRPDLDGGYRLPSEAEWEYAARAGSRTGYWFGDADQDLGRYIWYLDSAHERPQPVALKPANPWGLYEVHGNVWEWVGDCAHPSYAGAPSDGSAWTHDCQRMANGKPLRIARGGAWYLYPNGARSAFRFRYDPSVRHYGFGLRLARSITAEDR